MFQMNTGNQQQTSTKKEVLSACLDILKSMGVTILVFFVLSKTVFVNGVIPSSSMSPTLQVGDYVFSSRVAYWFDTPERGDIVFFYRDSTGDKTYVKRVVGVPGDIVAVKDGRVYVNDDLLDEPYVISQDTGIDFGPVEVPEGKYFLLGDNRGNSLDSRYWQETFISEENIYAKVELVFLPMEHFGILGA